MDNSLRQLLPALIDARANGEPLVLATLLATHGSTYRKPGAQVLFRHDGSYAGLLSGGCIESDLALHAAKVFRSGAPEFVQYDSRGADDVLFGLGSGCEGALEILLTRLEPGTHWFPVADLLEAMDRRQPTAWAVVVESREPDVPAGTFILLREDTITGLPAGISQASARWTLEQLDRTRAGTGPTAVMLHGAELQLFAARLTFPRELLLFGAGPDAAPVVSFAAELGWNATVVDHRPAYAVAPRFPGARRVVLARPDQLPGDCSLDAFDAAIVMSHHLPTDLAGLRVLASSQIPYVGLLGPASRRQSLLEQLSEPERNALNPRLHAPVGLDLGGRDPASIALAIVAEIQSSLHGRTAADVDWHGRR
jgi:xanthine dehydrogenase accessory factor